MAQLNIFNKAKENILSGIHDFSSGGNSHKVMLVQTSPSNVPVDTLSDPGYSTPSTQIYNLVGNEIDSGTNYTLGGDVLTATAITPTDGSSVTSTVDTTDDTTSWAVDGSNPSDLVEYAILYDDTPAGDPAWGWFDLGQTFDMQSGTLTFDWDDTNGLFTLA